ncbi:DUF6542 domain-containing protein [Streptomyces sp. NPDC052701]|uniref:DUF6542 domain-containing protein n=1 Tax=Streptomyces sp. NPDC052701 TaxID=3155533 RepID=UPI00343F7604
MEQHRTRPAQDGPRGGGPRPPLPPQPGRGAGGGTARVARPPGAAARPRPAPVRRPAPPARAVRRMPGPRLTGLGAGLFCGVAMFLLGCLAGLLPGASLTMYGVLFLPVCALTAVWVRRGDLPAAPVVAPIAFALGLVPAAGGADGSGDGLMGFVTALATQAGWLYAGTLVAGVIVLVRRVRPPGPRRPPGRPARPGRPGRQAPSPGRRESDDRS